MSKRALECLRPRAPVNRRETWMASSHGLFFFLVTRGLREFRPEAWTGLSVSDLV